MYSGSTNLPAERASKLAHLDVLKSELVNQLLKSFESDNTIVGEDNIEWNSFDTSSALPCIFAVDGSLQVVKSSTYPYKELAFVKTALIRLEMDDLAKLDQENPHPLALKKIMSNRAMYHATVFPLKYVTLDGMNIKDSVRRVIFDSLRDPSLNGKPYETLKWLAYRKWDKSQKSKSPEFECPYAHSKPHEKIAFEYDEDSMKCKHCKKTVYLSDMLGFHLEMDDESVHGNIASSYMLVHEMLMLFSGIMSYWESGSFDFLQRCLFLKDGPLGLRSQYSKIVPNIRAFFDYARSKNITIHLAGQEKTGYFVEYFSELERTRKIKGMPPIPENSYFVLENDYIKHQIQRRPNDESPYGERTNYGNKVFVKLKNSHLLVLSIPVGEHFEDASFDMYMGAETIFSTLTQALSYSHTNAVVPIQLANGIASLSSYPSAKVLHIFSDDVARGI